MRKTFFSVWVVRRWHKLSRVVGAETQEVFKAKLNGAWRNLVEWVSLPVVGGVELNDL